MKVKLHKGQYEVATDTHRFKVICAGRRWGKSVLSRLIVLKWARKQTGLYWIVVPTYDMGRQIHWIQGFLTEIPRLGKVDNFFRQAKLNSSDLSVTFPNGSQVWIKSAENPERLVGVKLRGLVIDEIARLKGWDYIWKEALRSTLVDYQAEAVFISTPKGYNHFYDLFMLGQDVNNKEFKSWQFSSYENPYIQKEELEATRSTMSDEFYQQEILAQFKRFVGLVYKDFDRMFHVKDLPDFNPIYYIRGLDRGYRHVTAMPIIGVNKDGVWYQTDELYQAGLTNPQLVDLIKQKCEGKTFELSTMDSANASDIMDIRDLGVDFMPVKKVSGESQLSYVRYKIMKFAEKLRIKDGKADYYVHPRCEKTIWEFENYSYPEVKSDEQEKESPIKRFDDMMDALGDLNAMHLHFYEENKKPPWANKLKGTYIEPAVIPDNQDDWENETTETDWDFELSQ